MGLLDSELACCCDYHFEFVLQVCIEFLALVGQTAVDLVYSSIILGIVPWYLVRVFSVIHHFLEERLQSYFGCFCISIQNLLLIHLEHCEGKRMKSPETFHEENVPDS